MIGNPHLTIPRTVAALAVACGLALGGSLAGLVPAWAVDPPGVPLPDGTYAFNGGTAVSMNDRWFFEGAVGVELVGGTARLVGDCLPYGSGGYTATPDGTWAFAVGTMSLKGCLPNASFLASPGLAALTQATTWQLVSGPAPQAGSGSPDSGTNDTPSRVDIVVTGPQGSFGLTRTPMEVGPVLAGDPAAIPAMEGRWRVESIERPWPAQGTQVGPYIWTVAIASTNSLLLPDGGYVWFVATPSGAFHRPSGQRGPAVPMALPHMVGVHNEYSELSRVLSAADHWEMPSDGTLVFVGGGYRVVLARPDAGNRAFGVGKVKPAVTTVRVGVGQTVRVPIAAEPLAPRAAATAALTWKNSRGAVARVTIGAGKKRATKTGMVTVPMNMGTAARVKVTGIKAGTSTLAFTAASGAKAAVKIVVVNRPIRPTRVTISTHRQQEAWMTHDDGTRVWNLDATARPAKSAGAVPEWSSSAPSIASVDSTGLVTLATGAGDYTGSVTITATVGTLKASYTLPTP
ncbi:MAG: Ig-like domain-containing protein [Bifidobacteriaceae bacterium]|jgi:hypothetical protein|nr:Ig-like domain-containing protein [Bifidobacteriaceae bacterium]